MRKGSSSDAKKEKESKKLYRDWRFHKNGVLNPVKDQKQCDMCWAIVTSEAVAAGYKLENSNRNLLLLSSQELLDCVHMEQEKCYPNKLSVAFEWIRANGIRQELNYPFEAVKGCCREKTEEEKKNSVWITGSQTVDYWDEDLLLEAVNERPVAGGINLTSEFMQYKRGVYSGSNNYLKDKNGNPLKHAILITGYGYDEIEDKKFWWIKNSYGEQWGDGGYGKIARRSSQPKNEEPLIFYTRYPTFK